VNFTTPQKVLDTIRAGDDVEWKRGNNRAKITASANGTPPLDLEQAKKMRLQINVNWGELASLLSHARRQYYNSFLRGTRFFRVTLPFAPETKRSGWEQIISDELNRPLKACKSFFHLHQYRWTDVVVHGVAAVLWEDGVFWKPKFIAREDLRIATDAETDFENLDWFGIRNLFTVGELVDKRWGAHADKKWNEKSLANILKNYKNVNYEDPMSYADWEKDPEKMAELVKQNLGYYSSDATPKIPIWTFYFKDTDKKWYKRAVPDTPSIRGDKSEPDKFLYTTNESCADHLQEILHCQFGDLSFKTPFKFHSVRSLGFELMEPTYWTNLTRCRFLQHVHENFSKWFQINDPAMRERAQSIDFTGPHVPLPPGVRMLPNNERHQIDPQMVEMAMAQLKQLMQEASSTYTQDVDTGTKKEQTAFETGVKVQQVNAMLSGLMLVALTMETFLYREITRRFFEEGSIDKDVQEFQRRVIQNYGIPRKYLKIEDVDIEVEAPLGAGNPTMEQVEAQKLLELRPMANPTAQQEMFHDALTVFAGAKRAARWAPIVSTPRMTEAKMQAQSDFASLMWGIEVPTRPELNAIEQIDVLLNSLSQLITRITNEEAGVPTPGELSGMMKVGGHTQELIKQLQANPDEKQNVKAFSDLLGRLMNEVKAFGQRLHQKLLKQSKAENGDNGNGKAKMQMMEGMSKMKLSAAESQQKMKIKEAEFIADQQRKNLSTAADIQRNRLRSLDDE